MTSSLCLLVWLRQNLQIHLQNLWIPFIEYQMIHTQVFSTFSCGCYFGHQVYTEQLDTGSHLKNCWHKLTWLSWDVAEVLWNVQGDCDNYLVLKGHRNAVLDLCWTTDGQHIISASPDKTVRAWDAMTGKQVFCSISSHNCCQLLESCKQSSGSFEFCSCHLSLVRFSWYWCVVDIHYMYCLWMNWPWVWS